MSLLIHKLPHEFYIRPKQETPCMICDKKTWSRCGGCNLVYFCSRNCLRVAWKKGHKQQCKQLQSRKREVENLIKRKREKASDPFLVHAQTKGYELNTSMYSEKQYFAWRKNTFLAEEKEKKRGLLLEWVKKTYTEYTVEVRSVQSYDEHYQLQLEVFKRSKYIAFLTFDFKEEWCRAHANISAAKDDGSLFRTQPVLFDGGWYLLVSDNYTMGSLYNIDFDKRSITNTMGSLGTTLICAICTEYYMDYNTLCSTCINNVCKKCSNTIREQNGGSYKCPFCRSMAHPQLTVVTCEFCASHHDSVSTCPTCKKKYCTNCAGIDMCFSCYKKREK
jgi:hypothetical protein